MRKDIKVAFLFDGKNDWISSYIMNSKNINNLKSRFIINHYFTTKELTEHDIVFILGYTRILKKNILDKGGVNLVVHESALPKGKGFSPVQWQVLEGVNEIPVSLIEVIDELDAGDIISSTTIKLNGYELLDEIRKKQADATIELVVNFLDIYPDYNRSKQLGTGYIYPRRTVEDDRLDPYKTFVEQFNHFRIANNNEHPLYFVLDDHKYILKIYKHES